MKQFLLNSWTVLVVFILSIVAVLVANNLVVSSSFTVCPDSEYCNSVYFDNPKAVKIVDHVGFPFKIKIGNVDWCEQGYDGICEEGTYHSEYKYYIYNAALIMAPSVLLVGLYARNRHPRRAHNVVTIIKICTISLVLGWIVNDFIMNNSVRGADLEKIGQNYVPPVAGFPFTSELGLANGCSMGAINNSAFEQCVAGSINYGGFWEKDTTIYANWIFWSALIAGAFASLKLINWTKRKR